MKSLAHNALFNLLKSFMSIIFPVVTFTYASRILMPEGMGKIEFVKSYVAYFSIVAMLGIVNYGTREGAKVRDDKEKLSNLASELFFINIISVILSYAIFIMTILFVPKLSGYIDILLIYSITIPLTAMGMEWLYSAVEDYRYIAIRTTIVQIGSVILMLLLVKNEDDLWKYALIQAVATTGSDIFNFIHLKKYVHINLFSVDYCMCIKKHIKPIAIMFCMTLFIQIFIHMDSTMLGFMTNDKYVGLYAASGKMTGMLSTMITSLSLVAMPRIAYYVEQKKENEIIELCEIIINLIMMLGIPATIGMIMLSKDMLILFCGQTYFEADIASKIMALRIILVPLNSFILLHLFIPMGKEKNNLWATSSAAIINLIINYILIPRYYHAGAAIGTVMAEGVELVVNIFFLSQIVNIKKIFTSMWQYIVASMSIVIVCSAINKISENALFSIIVVIVTSVVAYFLILILLKNKYINYFINRYEYRKHKED